MNDNQLDFSIPINQSQIKHPLLLGMVDQIATMFALVIWLFLNLAARSGKFFLLSLAVFILYEFILYLLAKYDPWIFYKLFESMETRSFYPAHSAWSSRARKVRKW